MGSGLSNLTRSTRLNPNEAFNILNHTQLADPTGDVTVPAQFGIIQSTINTTPIGSGTPRQIQLMLRLVL